VCLKRRSWVEINSNYRHKPQSLQRFFIKILMIYLKARLKIKSRKGKGKKQNFKRSKQVVNLKNTQRDSKCRLWVEINSNYRHKPQSQQRFFIKILMIYLQARLEIKSRKGKGKKQNFKRSKQVVNLKCHFKIKKNWFFMSIPF